VSLHTTRIRTRFRRTERDGSDFIGFTLGRDMNIGCLPRRVRIAESRITSQRVPRGLRAALSGASEPNEGGNFVVMGPCECRCESNLEAEQKVRRNSQK
jgi:hypothetical protein